MNWLFYFKFFNSEYEFQLPLHADIKIYQDVNTYVSQLDSDEILDFNIKEDKQIYFVQIEGASNINQIILNNGDAIEIVDEKQLNIKALENSHYLFVEMAKV